jgi:hypothetical protein
VDVCGPDNAIARRTAHELPQLSRLFLQFHAHRVAAATIHNTVGSHKDARGIGRKIELHKALIIEYEGECIFSIGMIILISAALYFANGRQNLEAISAPNDKWVEIEVNASRRIITADGPVQIRVGHEIYFAQPGTPVAIPRDAQEKISVRGVGRTVQVRLMPQK